jgi:hypothetical protein
MSDKYIFSSGLIDIQGISINPNISAKVQCLCFYNVGVVQMKFVEIAGEEYINWGNDDDYLISLVGHKLGMGERIEPNDPLYPTKPFKNYNFTITDNLPTTINDNKSIHNDADVAKIETLQSQLDEQRIKLKTITDLLINKGMI